MNIKLHLNRKLIATNVVGILGGLILGQATFFNALAEESTPVSGPISAPIPSPTPVPSPVPTPIPVPSFYMKPGVVRDVPGSTRFVYLSWVNMGPKYVYRVYQKEFNKPYPRKYKVSTKNTSTTLRVSDNKAYTYKVEACTTTRVVTCITSNEVVLLPLKPKK